MKGPSPRSILLGLTGLTVGGGVASVSRCLVTTLDTAQRSGRLDRVDRVLLLDPPPGPPPPAPPAVQRLAGGWQLGFALQFWRQLAAFRPDLVLFDHLGLGRALRVPLPWVRDLPYAVFLHGLELQNAEHGVRAAVIRGAWRLLANSEVTRDHVIERFPECCDRVHVVPLCVEPAKVALWDRLLTGPAPPREPAALIVGRMWAEQRGKGHDALIESWPAVRARIPEAELWIAGEGNDAQRLREKARALGQSQAVRFLGRVSDEDLSRLYQRASVFAMPSRQEGFGLVYIEAMRHGLPCIGSTADAARCVVDDTCGRLVPYGDAAAIAHAITSLLESPDLARRLGEGGRRRVERDFSLSRFSETLCQALRVA
jgi:phosphatidyl-myo-inositol dimannoside synthase